MKYSTRYDADASTTQFKNWDNVDDVSDMSFGKQFITGVAGWCVVLA